MLLGVGLLWADATRRGAVVDEPARLSPVEALNASPAAPGALVAGEAPAAADPAAADPAAVDPAPVAEEPAPTAVVERRGGVECAPAHRLAMIDRDLPIHATPGGARSGTFPATSKYLGEGMVAWVQELSADGRWGRVTVPWGQRVNRAGWIPLTGVQLGTTRTMAVADLSTRRMRVYRGCDQVLDVASAVGAPGSPSPRGRFFVTDRVAVPANQPYFGSYAFGLSTIQPSPPAGWTGGNQMAIHGTNTPQSIGTAASAGCLRVNEQTLARLKPLLRLGTPVIIQA
ncbi:MAG: ErfK/YbiS/YcfS/YnhG family protein [Thermoleophilia bacterium]|nr:ErfK/YbiS/YcfS/YnhG family protein [Thermoleophilia bacterium]